MIKLYTYMHSKQDKVRWDEQNLFRPCHIFFSRLGKFVWGWAFLLYLLGYNPNSI